LCLNALWPDGNPVAGLEFFWILFLLLLPLLSTLLLLINEAMGEGRKLLNLVQNLLLGLFFGGGLYIVFPYSTELSLRMWGIWLYLISIGILLTFEMLSHVAGRRYAYA
jgi:hypothetical protein